MQLSMFPSSDEPADTASATSHGSQQEHVLHSPLQLPLDGSNLIEASAGTGKTYTIAALYVRFILAHIATTERPALREKPLLPPNILVVTFTKAATAELKDRIRQRLVEAAQWFRSEPDTVAQADEFLTQLRSQYDPQLWPSCAYALQVASEWMDEASVKTIHSWCQSLLKEHAFSSGSLFTQELTTELQRFRQDAGQDYWREHVYALGAEAYNAVQAVASGPLDLVQKCLPLWPLVGNSKPVALDIEALWLQQQALHLERIAAQQKQWLIWHAQILNTVEQADQQGLLLNKRKVSPNATKRALSAIQDWLALSPAEAAIQPPNITAAMLSNYSVQGFSELVDMPVEHLPWLGQLETLKQVTSQGASIREPLLRHAAQWIRQRYYDALQRHALMSFDDIIAQCRHALEGSTGDILAAQVRTDYPIAMVDEFQDTDPDQYAIFKAIYPLQAQQTAQNDSAIFLIGDPKQAIYAFRGADIYTYLQARRDTEGRHFTLAKNFRSSANMVAAANAIFLPAEQQRDKRAFLFNRPQGNQVPFVEVEAHGQKAQWIVNGQPQHQALTLWQQQNPDDPGKVLGSTEYVQQQAQSCASYIVELLTGAQQGVTGFQRPGQPLQPLQRADIAILVNSRREGAQMQRALRERGVASVYLSDRQSVFESLLAPDVLRILLACAHPEQRQVLTDALYSPILAISIDDLAALQHDDEAWDKRVEQFMQYADIWRRRGVLALIQRWIHDFAIAARLLAAPGGERDMTDLLHLAELLQQASTQLDGEQALLRYLRDKIYQPSDEGSDEQTVRLESDSELVQIVTVHKSKGLEYPLVFLPFSSVSRPLNSKQPVFSYHDEQGELCYATELTDTVQAQVNEERLGEEIRRLYVALTRAKYATWASVASVRHWQHGAFAYLANAEHSDSAELPAQVSATWGQSQHVSIASQPPANDAMWQAPIDDVVLAGARQMPAGHQFNPWWVASYSALRYGSSRTPQTSQEANLFDDHETDDTVTQYDDAQRQIGRIHHLPRGAQPGTLLHGILEDAAAHGFAEVAARPELAEELVAKRCRHGVWLDLQDDIRAWLLSYLSTPFALPQGNLCRLSGLQVYQPEPEFWLSIQAHSTVQLDALITQSILPDIPRPPLQPMQLQGMLKGFIDLLFEYEGRYYVADYKSNYIGARDEDYQHTQLTAKMLGSRYDVQYALYSLALHRLLQVRLGDAYCFDSHFGGIVYMFMRGHHGPCQGVFTDRPQQALLDDMSALMLNPGQEA
ncbi:MAG: exodeoxyribonuclease V subunit beta [Firmicutes bacterium]|nr:exodeoxyribonuclease V subunit beta [Bacillota bacterium]